MAMDILASMRKKLEDDKKKSTNQSATVSNIPAAKKTTSNTTTKAGTAPAFGVSAKSGPAMPGARTFAEYTALRRKQEEEEGMKSAAEKLAGKYGYSKVGNQVVFLTPGSHLPTPTKENTATKAQAPGAYGIKPADYEADMSAVHDYVTYRYDPETQEFLDKYFKGQLPSEEAFETMFKHYARGGVETEPDVMNFHRGAELVRKATEEKQGLKSAYDDAIGRLGEDAIKYISPNESDYYERFGNTYGAADVLNNRTETYNPKTQAFLDQYFDGKIPTEKEFRAKLAEYAAGGVENEADVMNLNAGAYLISEGQNVKGPGSSDAMTLEEAEKYNMTQFANLGNDRFDLRRWSQTTPEERAAYQLMEQYGYADEYLKSLEPELNKRIAEVKTAEAAQFAEDKPFWANVSSIVKAPVAGLGALEMGANKLMGKEIDLYDPRLTIARQNEAIREQTASGMSGVGKFFYNTGMSIADNIANMLVWGGLGSFATSLSMGGSSAASAFTSAVERGANEKQALTAALVSGVAETLFEKFSLDNVIEMSKGNKLGSHVLNVLKQMGIEGSEEFATGLANEIADRAIMGDLSNYELLVDYYVKQGLMEDVARRKAEWSSAGEIGLGTLGGIVSGGVMGTGGEIIGGIRNRGARNVQKELDAAAKALVESETKKNETPATVPEAANTMTPEEQQLEKLEREYENLPAEQETEQPATPAAEPTAEEKRAQERNEREDTRQYKQDEAQQGEQPADEAEQSNDEKPAETAENAQKTEALDKARGAKVTDDDGNEHNVRVVGVESVTDGEVVLKLEDENGEPDYSLASEVQFDGPEGELLGSKGVERMDAKGVRNYLQNYDDGKATPQQYATAYNEVYQRGNAGLSYEDAAVKNQNARTYLTENARLAAYAAGLNAYNQTHERVQPAAIGTAQGATSGSVQMSAKDSRLKGKVSRQYSQNAFSNLGRKGRKKAIAQMEILSAIASRTGRTIVMVDSITDADGNRANALYDMKTGEIRVALDTDEGAYAYVAVHELTHAIKNEHASEWDGFVKFVRSGLERNNQKWDDLVKYQMDRFGYDRETAEEEVICNTVPALLQDESNMLRLYKNNRKLFDRVVDWVKGLLEDVKTAGKNLSARSKSWEQMDALAGDRELLQGMYDRLMKVMEKPGESRHKGAGQKLSASKQAEESFKNAQKKYAGKDLANNKSLYDYDFLIALPNMTITNMADINAVRDEGSVSEEKVISLALENGKKNGRVNGDLLLVQNDYTGRNIRLTTSAIRHGLGGRKHAAQNANARAFAKAGDLMKNAVPINAMHDTGKAANGTYAMAAYMQDEANNVVQIAVLTVEQRSGAVINMEMYDTLHAMNTRKWNVGDHKTQSKNSSTRSIDISIADFLEIVNETHQSLLSEDVLAHFNEERNPQGYYSGRAKFSMSDVVEETRDMLAVHNLTEENMRNAMELGGLAMPSIAVIKAEQGHSMYGTISVLFNKNTIDPQANRDNEVYGSDAWTPVFPQIEYEVDEEVESRIRQKYQELRAKVGDASSRVLYSFGNDLEHKVNNAGSVEKIVDDLSWNTDMMQLYLADSGKEMVDPVVKRTVRKMEPEKVKEAELLIEKLGSEAIKSYRPLDSKGWMNKYGFELADAYEEALATIYGFDNESIKLIMDDPTWRDAKKALANASRYLRNGAEKVVEETDYEATQKAIVEATNKEAYQKWLNDLFEGAVKNKGIRNDTELFTPSGKRRKFNQLHWDVTLDNVVRAMRKQDKTGIGTLGRSIEGAAVKQYGSIEDIKADSGRLGKVDEAEYEAMRKEFRNRFTTIAREYAGTKDQFDAGDVLVEFVTKSQTAEGIYKLMQKEKAFYKPSMDIAEELAELVNEMKNAPTGYFEAKPRRAVGFDEMAALIVPDNMDKALKDKLEENGANLIEYEAGNENDRLAKMNGPEVNHLLFSLSDVDDNVRDAVNAQQKAFELVKGHRITAAEADKLAGTILKKANSDYERQQLAAEISRIYDFVERGEDVDMRQIEDEMTDLMARVMSKAKALDMEHEEMAKPIREYLRTTPIAMTAAQMKEAESLAGSYGAFRKSMFGRVRLSNLGRTKLDTAWQELSEMNPELFPPDAREGDMPALLQKAVDALKPVYNTGMGMSEEESAEWLMGQMNEAYFALPAVKASAQNAKEFAGNVEAMTKAMKRFEETSWSEYQNALRGIEQARGEQAKTQKQKETAAMRKKYESWRDRDTAQRKEREMKAKYRVKIERTTNTLMNWMQKPTDAKHVPAGVQDSLRRMLQAFDFSGKTTKTAEDLSARINELATAIEKAQEGEDKERTEQTIFLERDQQMIDELRRMAEIIRGNAEHNQREGRGVYELNGLEMKELSKWLDVVKHVITEASKLRGSTLPGESVEQVAAMSMQEMSSKKALKDKKWITKQWNEAFGPDMQDSFTFFEKLGPTANAIFMELRKGFDKVTVLTRKAEEYTKSILEGVDLTKLTGKKAKEFTFNLKKGGTLKMTKANIMELYVLSKREQAQSHIYGGGVRISGDNDARPQVLTKADVDAIVKTLTADEKRIADGMQQFLSKDCASWGNETSVRLLGYKKFGEEYYWPIKTDSNSRNTTKLEDNFAANISAIKNQGMTKQTVEGASNPIMIGDIFDTYTKHISNMAAYSAYALPLSDFTRWYNSRGVKTEIEQMLGKKGLDYINNFLMAVNGSGLQASATGLEKVSKFLTRNAKIASVGWNVRVVVQQPTSYARAAMYMSPKYLSLALGKRTRDIELINKYCGIAQWKDWGFYETNIGPNLRQMIVGDDSTANKLRGASTWLAGEGDKWTLKHLWNACELETQELYPELKVGTDEYFRQVGERMSEIVDRTQVVDSVFHRSQLMRSKSGTAQMLTNFMSEPTKTYNMLMSAISEYAENRKNKAARNRVARAFAVYAATGVLTAAAAAVVDAFRDDDAEKDWAEKYMSAVGENAKDNLNPLGLLPGVSDVMSLMQGYEPSRLDTQSIQKILWAKDEIEKIVAGKSNANAYGVIYKIAQAFSSMSGIPVSNVMRDMNALVRTVTGTDITKTAEAQKADTVTRMYRMLMDGNKAEGKKLREQLIASTQLSPKDVDTRIANKLMEEPEIAEAWKEKTAKNYAAMNRIKNQLTGMGFAGEAVDKAIVRYGEKQEPKEEKPKDPGEQLSVTLYSEEEVVNAMRALAGLEKGNVTEADVRAMISERVSTSKAKDPEKTVKSNIQGELRKTYLEMEAKGNTNGMKRLGMVMKNLLKTDEDTMTGWVRDAHADQLREAVDGYNSGKAATAVAKMRADGKTDSQIKSSLKKYQQLYIDAIKRNDKVTANKIKRMLQSLGLKSTKGKDLYSDSVFEDWLKEK